ncbi:MAG: Acyl-CoA synthetase [Pseudonocardia sp.]|nr:Acyl-CoA synthetase [Pseudonocardia sp.]
MRELDDGDGPLVAALHRDLPAYDRYLRFFSAGVVPTDEVALRATRPGDLSLGAFRGDRLVGVARCVVTAADGTTAEVALAVAHPEQARGVGTLLLEHVASRARRRGVRRLVADVLAENSRMRQVIADIGLPVRWSSGDDGQHVELDLDPVNGYLDALAEREERADVTSLTAVLAPRSVAVVGASRRAGSVGNAVLRRLLDGGFTGRVAAVNPHAAQVCGVACHASVAELPEPVDLAVVCVPASAVPDVAEQCGRRGVRALLVVTSGLSADPPLASRLLDVTRRYDLRMVGPNCLGVANTAPAVQLDATFAGPAPAGDVGVVTQSGGVAIAVQEQLRRLGLGVSTMVSAGDKYDVSGNDLLLWWHGDDRTRMAVLYLESFGNPRKFSRFARRLARRIPVLTVRSGSSAAGQRAVASHTAATATPRVTRDALFRQAGVLAVDRVDELVELVATLSCQPLPAGPRVAVISNAGGAGVLAADACVAHGLEVSPLSGRTQRALRRLLPAAAATGNPVDTSAAVTPEVFATAISTLRADPDVDAVVAVTVPTALTDPCRGVAGAATGAGAPLLAVRLDQPEHVVAVAAPGATVRVPSFADPAPAAAALAHAVGRARWLARPHEVAARPSGVDAVRASGVVARFLAARPQGGWLDARDVEDLLAAFGLPILPTATAATPQEAVAAYRGLGRPVAVKAVAEGVVHKAAAGGVRLGLSGADAVDRAAGELAAAFGPRLRGFLVQPMATPGPELLVGVTSDAIFGPLVTVGLGGTATDLAVDRAHRLAPLSSADAQDMLTDFAAGARLFGPDRASPVDRDAIHDAVIRVGRLAELLPEVAELDLNPVIAGPHGCVVIDARIRVAAAAQGDPALRALPC